jgi:hypothetical protein
METTGHAHSIEMRTEKVISEQLLINFENHSIESSSTCPILWILDMEFADESWKNFKYLVLPWPKKSKSHSRIHKNLNHTI